MAMNKKPYLDTRINIMTTKNHRRRFRAACRIQGVSISDSLRAHMDKVILKVAKNKKAAQSVTEGEKEEEVAFNNRQGELNV